MRLIDGHKRINESIQNTDLVNFSDVNNLFNLHEFTNTTTAT